MKAERFVLISIFLLFTGLLANSCKKDSEEGSAVYFDKAVIEISTDDLSDVKIGLTIDPPAVFSSSIRVKVISTGSLTDGAVSITPEIVGDSILIPVVEGDTAASFIVSPLEDGIGYDDVEIEFEISSVDSGLVIFENDDIKASLTILNTKASGSIQLPYVEDFSDMLPRSTIYPDGWKEFIVSQHTLGEAHWYYTTYPSGMLEINPWSPEGATNDPAEVWIISPRISFIKASNPVLSVQLDRRIETWDPNSGNMNPIEYTEYDFFISTDYDGINVGNATWERYQPLVDDWDSNNPDDDEITNAGPYDLSKYEGELVSMAFVYYAASQASSTILRFGALNVKEAK